MTELPSRPSGTIVRAEAAACWIDGFAFLERAKAEAQALASSTQTVVDDAREDGFRTGRQSGEVEASALLLRTTREVDGYLAGLEGQLADLTIGIVRQILGSFDKAELVASVVRQALVSFRQEAVVTVRVAPDLVEGVETLLKSDEQLGPLLVVAPDPYLSEQQCVIASPAASIDVGIDAQLETIRKAMAQTRADA